MLFVWMLVTMGSAVRAQESHNIEILRQSDILVAYISGNQPINIQGFGFSYVRNGANTITFLGEAFPAFQGAPLENLPTPACFVLRPLQTQTPLPPRCQAIPANNLFSQILFDADLFWINKGTGQEFPFQVMNGQNALTTCPAGQPSCLVNFPVLGVILPTPTQAPPMGTECRITETMNILYSGDVDGDSFSDFEEACILATPMTVPTADTDRDQVPDRVEDLLNQIQPGFANPSRLDDDRDGDLLFDIIELSLGTDLGNPDSDGDLIGDFLEFYWQIGDPRTINPDTDGNGFPDVLQPFLPPSLPANARCEFNVTLDMSDVWVVNPEEADGFDIIIGDEPEMTFGLDVVGLPQESAYRQQWSAEGVEQNDRVGGFNTLPTRIVECGDTLEIFITLSENDAPLGGISLLGESRTRVPILFVRAPVAWDNLGSNEVIFSGTVEDGQFDYRVYYDLTVAPVN